MDHDIVTELAGVPDDCTGVNIASVTESDPVPDGCSRVDVGCLADDQFVSDTGSFRDPTGGPWG